MAKSHNSKLLRDLAAFLLFVRAFMRGILTALLIYCVHRTDKQMTGQKALLSYRFYLLFFVHCNLKVGFIFCPSTGVNKGQTDRTEKG